MQTFEPKKKELLPPFRKEYHLIQSFQFNKFNGIFQEFEFSKSNGTFFGTEEVLFSYQTVSGILGSKSFTVLFVIFEKMICQEKRSILYPRQIDNILLTMF